MKANTARGLVNQILYDIDRVDDPRDRSMAARCADSIINRRHFSHPVEWYAEALSLTLGAGRLSPQTSQMSRRYSEAELLGFLTLLAECLDEARPWPRPAFVKRDIAEWAAFGEARAIAKIVRPMHQINGILNAAFDFVPLGEERLPVMILELRSGEVVALMGSIEPKSMTFLLMRRDPGDPVALITRFCEYTRFSAREVIPLT
ncbi:MAG: hypothetical protein HKP61_17275 [Dactylosporangium sp.]|nr:hypothetical protein [Dactylosporangium sp.]NNJ62658.1 hypothetical protein [Dactylosporangium sp.]